MSEAWVWMAAAAVASCVSAAVAAVGVRYRQRLLGAHGNAACLSAVVVGVIVGHALLSAWPHWPPINALDRFLVVGLPATILLLLIGKWPTQSRPMQWGLCVLFALCLTTILLHRSVYLQEGLARSGVLLATSAGLLVVAQSLLARLWDHTRQASIPLALAATLFATGLLILMAGYIKGGSVALLWSAALAGTTIAACLSSHRADLRGVTSLAVVLLGGFLFIGRFFGGLTTGCTLLVLVTPLCCWTGELPGIRGWVTWKKECLCLTLVAATLLAILWSAKQTFDREMGPHLSDIRPVDGDGTETTSRIDSPRTCIARSHHACFDPASGPA
jgi:hypothetical protein